MTAFYCLMTACGLSNQEAADFLGVSLGSIEGWKSGRRNAPDGVFSEMRTLWRSMMSAAQMAAETIEQSGVEETEIGLASDDHEAEHLGLPCVGAHRALLGMIIAMTDVRIAIVPRGSTSTSVDKKLVTEGKVVSVSNCGFVSVPVSEAEKTNPEVKKLVDKVKNNEIAATAPCDSMYLSWTEDDLARLDTAILEAFGPANQA